MSKANADFSAFDFNDSSDNSDIETTAAFLNRANANNKRNNHISSKTNNNNNNNNINKNISCSSSSNSNSSRSEKHQNNNNNNNNNIRCGQTSRSNDLADQATSSSSNSSSSSSNCGESSIQHQRQQLHNAIHDAYLNEGKDKSNNAGQSVQTAHHSDVLLMAALGVGMGIGVGACPKTDNGADTVSLNLPNSLGACAALTTSSSTTPTTPTVKPSVFTSTSTPNANLTNSDQLSNGVTLDRNSEDDGSDDSRSSDDMLQTKAVAADNHLANSTNCHVESLLGASAMPNGNTMQEYGHSNASSHLNQNSNNNNFNNGHGSGNEMIRRNSNASLSNNSLATHTAGSSGGIGGGSSVCGERKKYRHQNYSKNIYIGTKNAEKWEHMRTRLQFKNDVEFVAYLLNLADNDTERLNQLPIVSASTTPTKAFDDNFKLEPNLSVKEFDNSLNAEKAALPADTPQQPQQQQQSNGRRKYKKRVQFSDAVNGAGKIKNLTNCTAKAKDNQLNGGDNQNDLLPEVLDCRIAEKIKSELEEKSASKESLCNALHLKKSKTVVRAGQEEEDEENESIAATTDENIRLSMCLKGKRGPKMKLPPIQCPEDEDDDELTEDDEEEEEIDDETLAQELKNEQNFVEEEDEVNIALRSQQSCKDCSLTHDYKACPLRMAIATITDSVDLAEWIERKNLEALAKLKADAQRLDKHLHEDDDEDMDETSQMSELETKPLITFAEASVPAEFELHNVEPNVTGVFARTEVRSFTKLGPLIGQPMQASDIREGGDMKWLFEICEAGAQKSQFLMCDNPNSSNWLRYIRPAPSYDERNVNLLSIDAKAFFVTCRDLKNGTELLYWSDDCNTMWRKKHWSDKLHCGGCNLKFDHALYYRTHCSVFHDPSMSLTIRKYHCKICGEAVLGKDSIMKHAAEKHDGKGAHQCHFCNKYFLRINYLEMHRTYGCQANPNRTRPICDFCGRKFYRPQKLRVHIKRTHSDMAEVLRDYQCKLCSKLVGSRAALQRHAKEVHSRNSTVVSCPRCQKLFQNRSNLKIHMLTHSGVRPFKCSEAECNAAFTTKQCLQFHYKKVHNYSQEQMPKIERSVAYTFDAYSGGMKVDFLEQAPRRRRKSLEDQNSILSSSMQSDAEFSDDNIFEAIKKSGKSIKDLCRNEPNLSLLSSKITSIFGEKPVAKKRGRKRKEQTLLNDNENTHNHMEQMRRKQSAQLSLVESFLTSTAQRLTAQQQVQQVVAAAAAVSAMAGGQTDDNNKLHLMHNSLSHQHMQNMQAPNISAEEDDEDDEDDDEQAHSDQQLTHDNGGYRHQSAMGSLGQHLVMSKGSKKWISNDERHMSRDCSAPVDRCALSAAQMGGIGLSEASSACNLNPAIGNDMSSSTFAVPSLVADDSNKLMGTNRDFLSRLINSANASHSNHAGNAREEDENTSFLDVVESNNNNNTNATLTQYHHNASNHTANVINGSGGGSAAVAGPGSASNMNAGNDSVAADAAEANPMSMNSLAVHQQSFMNSFYNNGNSRLSGSTTGSSSSASMLVEAALNSVGNIMEGETHDLKVPTDGNINANSPMSSQVEVDNTHNRFNTNNPMENLESELKMMKNLNNFPMQIPPLPMFPNSANNLGSCSISPSASTPTNPRSNQNNDVDVDAGSTPRAQHMTTDVDPYAANQQHRTPPTPQPISPGRDYSMFGNNARVTPGAAATAGSGSSVHSSGANSNIPPSSPLPATCHNQNQRRNAASVASTYPDHELVSPASSPSVPRYHFGNDIMRHKQRAEHETDHRRQSLASMGLHSHLSSDEENSMMPHNSVVSGQDMRLKFSQPQMDLMYSKYESLANSAALKYNNSNMDSPSEYRSSVSSSTAPGSNDISDMQGLDMSSRSTINSANYHHNFQLSSNTPVNLPTIGRYHHHIYDILSEREQTQQSQLQSQQHQQHQQHHAGGGSVVSAAVQHHHQQDHSSQLAMQHHQSAMHSMLSDQLNEQEHDQATSVDLSRTANYVVPSPPQLAYNHPHHDMLRMASLDLAPNGNMPVGNNRSFLSSQMQHQSRESLEHHRLLSTVEQHRILAASNAAAADQHRLLVDPTAHLLMEQNNRLLGSDQSRLLGESAQNRHMARGFGAYHQVATGNYHHGVRPPVLPTANHHPANPTNYHPFPAYY